jgi:anthranilate phosphoribosyltransferase
MSVKNPFPYPDTINPTKNNEIKEIIRQVFQGSGSLQFHDMVKFFEQAIIEKDLEKAKISAYYCSNAVIGQHTITKENTEDIITGMVDEITKLMYELENEDSQKKI